MQKGLPVSCQILQPRTNKALPSLPKNKQQQKENKQQQKKRSRMGAVLLVGDDGGCFQPINLSVSLLGRAETVLKRQMLKKKKEKKKEKKKNSNHSLVFLYLWP